MANITQIHMGSDHAGFDMKEDLKEYLERKGYDVVDHGAFEFDPEDDYPDFIFPVAVEIARDPEAIGIVLGGSGQGEAIAANKVPGVRAIVFNGQYAPLDDRDVPQEVSTARQHNNANVLALGTRFLNMEEAVDAVDTFLETDFSGEERHIRRLQKINDISQFLA